MTTNNKEFQPIGALGAPAPASSSTTKIGETTGPIVPPASKSGDHPHPVLAAKSNSNSKKPMVVAGIVLGMGFGGLADGIILHQILGWHHLVCYTMNCQPASIAQLQHENTQDGYFHLGLWLTLLVGTAMLLGAARQAGPAASGRVLGGAMLAGSGLFNFFEGLINHQILGIHHVLPGTPHQFLYDMLYLANGVLFFLFGGLLVRSSKVTAA